MRTHKEEQVTLHLLASVCQQALQGLLYVVATLNKLGAVPFRRLELLKRLRVAVATALVIEAAVQRHLRACEGWSHA